MVTTFSAFLAETHDYLCGMEGGGRREGGESEGVRDSLLFAETHDYLCIGQKHTPILPSEF